MTKAETGGQRYSILAVGEVNIDLILSGLPRVPEFGTELLASGFSKRLGGCTANFAVFCARLDEKVALVSCVGDDEFGSFLIEELSQHGVSIDYVRYEHELPTGVTVALSGPCDRAFVTHLGTIDSVRTEDIPDELLARSDHLHIASYFLQSKLRAGLPDLLHRARAADVTSSLDTGYDPDEDWNKGLAEVLPLVDVFLPNEVEATSIADKPSEETAALALAEIVDLVVVKLGDRGCMAACGGQTLRAGAYQVNVVDTTCCGDAFNAGFLRAWRRGENLEDCLQQGNAAGALIAGGPGNCAERLSVSAVHQLTGVTPPAPS